MRNSTSFRIARRTLSAGIALAFYCVLLFATSARAQGINSDGTDFFLGFMPGIPHQGTYWSTTPVASYFLICSYQSNNQVNIDYFDGGGNEINGKTLILSGGMCEEVPIDKGMQPTKPGEIQEYKAAHIHSRYPISVQFYSEGSSSGSSYLAMPTAALGTSYVVAAWLDNPLRNNPGSINRDSSSSEFMIVAPYDNTSVTYTPNSTTYAGTVGVNTGAGHTGSAHPVTITLRRGQIYWVRSNPQDISDDLSGSTIVANKPIVVLGGQERGLDADPSIWPTLNNDIRNTMFEQMPPVVDWGTDYPSIPTMPASIEQVLHTGDGDMYRIYTNDPTGMSMNRWQGTSPAQQYGPNGVSLYQAPAMEFDNITDPVDLVTDPRSITSSGNLKKMYAVQYLYFQGHHDAGVDTRTGSGKGGTPQSGGGDATFDETSYRADEMMDLVPIDHWKTSTIFMVPQNSYYGGFQFINVITNKDSLRNITISRNNGSPGTLGTYIPASRTYQIPLHPELVGLTIKLPSGSYIISGNTPLACYSYGRTEKLYKDIWGYAAPTGQAYGSHAQPNPPTADITPSCGQWNVHIHEGGTGGGIADVLLLNDPNGFYVKPPEVSYNCTLLGNGTDASNVLSPPFIVGDSSLNFTVQVQDPSKDAYAAIYAVDLSGNDTVIRLHYSAPALALSTTKIAVPDTLVLTQQCSSMVFHVSSTGSLSTDSVSYTLYNDSNALFDVSTIPALPSVLEAGDSIVFNVCYTPQDTLLHKDSIKILAGCIDTTFYVQAKGLTPIIVADDHDFGDVTVGTTQPGNIHVKNIGNAPLVLTTGYHLFNNPDYTFTGTVPVTIMPNAAPVSLPFSFTPTRKGTDDSRMDWGTNINTESIYAHHNKDTSALLGYGRSAGLTWDRHNQQFTVECTDTQVIRVWLQNTSSGSEGADLTIDTVNLTGQNAGDWQILDIRGDGTPNSGITAPFQLVKGDTTGTWVDLLFKPNPLQDGFNTRFVSVAASGQTSGGTWYSDTLSCVGVVRHAIVTINPPSYNFGVLLPDSTAVATYTITNTGDTAYIFSGLASSDPSFTILSGPGAGDTLYPGMTDTMIVQYTALHNGGASSTVFAANGDHSLCNQPQSLGKGLSSLALTTATPTTFPLTYICHNDTNYVSFKNIGTVGVLLDSVEIIDSAGLQPVSDEFAFDTTGAVVITPQLLNLGMGVDTGTTVTFPITYSPKTNSNVAVEAVFYWEDTSRGQTLFHQQIRPITGIGYQTANLVSLPNPAGLTTPYSAVTASTVTMPIQLHQQFDTVAQIYGVQFSLRYYRDEFQNPQVTPDASSGIQLANNPAAEATADPADNNYELLPIHLTSASPITTSNALGSVTWQYVVAKDSVSAVQVKDLMFLDNTGSSACWVAAAADTANFYGLNTCGDATLRNFLKGGLPVLSIGSVVPNPAMESATVAFTVAQNATPVTMRVYNALGQPVETVMNGTPYDKGTYSAGVDASELPSGLYTLYLSAPGCGAAKQMLVTK